MLKPLPVVVPLIALVLGCVVMWAVTDTLMRRHNIVTVTVTMDFPSPFAYWGEQPRKFRMVPRA